MSNQQLSAQLGKALAAANTGRPMGSDELSETQRDAVAYFFAHLKAADPSQHDVLIPDDKTSAVLRRFYAPYVKDFSREQIDAGFHRFHQRRQAGDPAFKWLNIDQLIGLTNGTLKLENEDHRAPAGIYKVWPSPYDPNSGLALPDKTSREQRNAAARPHLDSLKGLLQDDKEQ